MTAQELIQGLEQYTPEQRLKILQGMRKDGVKVDGLDINRPPEQVLSIIDKMPRSAKVPSVENPEGVLGESTSKQDALKKMGETQREFMKRTISVMDLSDKLNVMDDAEKINYLKKLQKEGYSLSSEDLGGKKVSNDWLKDVDLDNPKDFGKVKNKIISAGVKTAQQQFSKGGRKSIEQTATGLASLAGKGVEKTAGLAGADVDLTSGLDKFRDEKLAYKNRGENIGGTATDIATLFTGGGAAAKLAGKAEKAASFGQKFKRLAKLSGLEAGATGAYTAAKEGKLNSKVAKDAALAGGLTFGLGSVFGTGKKALSWLTEPKDSKAYRKAIAALEKGGVDERSVNILKNLDDSGKKALLKYVDATKERIGGQIGAKGAMSKAAEDVNKFFKAAQEKAAEMRKPHSVAKEALAEATVKTQPLRKSIIKLMKKNQVKFLNGKPNYEDSVFKQDSGVREMFEDVLRVTRQPKANAGQVENLTKLIDSKFNYLLSQGRTVEGLDSVVSSMKKMINKSVYKAGSAGKAFQKTDTEFAKLLEPLGQVRAAGTVKTGDGGEMFDAYQILNRSLSTASGKSDKAIENISAIKKAFGIKGAKNLPLKAELASIAERMTGDVKPRSIEGIASQAGGMVANTVPGGQVLGSAFKFAKNLKKAKKGTELLETIARTPTKPKPQPIVNFLKKNLTGAGSKVIIPSAIAGLFAKKD